MDSKQSQVALITTAALMSLGALSLYMWRLRRQVRVALHAVPHEPHEQTLFSTREDVRRFLLRFASEIHLDEDETMVLLSKFVRTDGSSFLRLTEAHVKERVLDAEIAQLLWFKLQDCKVSADNSVATTPRLQPESKGGGGEIVIPPLAAHFEAGGASLPREDEGQPRMEHSSVAEVPPFRPTQIAVIDQTGHTTHTTELRSPGVSSSISQQHTLHAQPQPQPPQRFHFNHGVDQKAAKGSSSSRASSTAAITASAPPSVVSSAGGAAALSQIVEERDDAEASASGSGGVGRRRSSSSKRDHLTEVLNEHKRQTKARRQSTSSRTSNASSTRSSVGTPGEGAASSTVVVHAKPAAAAAATSPPPKPSAPPSVSSPPMKSKGGPASPPPPRKPRWVCARCSANNYFEAAKGSTAAAGSIPGIDLCYVCKTPKMEANPMRNPVAVRDRPVVCVMGPRGSGKSTMLQVLFHRLPFQPGHGLESPLHGSSSASSSLLHAPGGGVKASTFGTHLSPSPDVVIHEVDHNRLMRSRWLEFEADADLPVDGVNPKYDTAALFAQCDAMVYLFNAQARGAAQQDAVKRAHALLRTAFTVNPGMRFHVLLNKTDPMVAPLPSPGGAIIRSPINERGGRGMRKESVDGQIRSTLEKDGARFVRYPLGVVLSNDPACAGLEVLFHQTTATDDSSHFHVCYKVLSVLCRHLMPLQTACDQLLNTREPGIRFLDVMLYDLHTLCLLTRDSNPLDPLTIHFSRALLQEIESKQQGYYPASSIPVPQMGSRAFVRKISAQLCAVVFVADNTAPPVSNTSSLSVLSRRSRPPSPLTSSSSSAAEPLTPTTPPSVLVDAWVSKMRQLVFDVAFAADGLAGEAAAHKP